MFYKITYSASGGCLGIYVPLASICRIEVEHHRSRAKSRIRFLMHFPLSFYFRLLLEFDYTSWLSVSSLFSFLHLRFSSSIRQTLWRRRCVRARYAYWIRANGRWIDLVREMSRETKINRTWNRPRPLSRVFRFWRSPRGRWSTMITRRDRRTLVKEITLRVVPQGQVRHVAWKRFRTCFHITSSAI